MAYELILFGAGGNGKAILKKFQEQVRFFCDNDEAKIGTVIDGKEVICFEKMIHLHREGYKIIVTPNNAEIMARQLKMAGIDDYIMYSGNNNFANAIEEEKKAKTFLEPRLQMVDDAINKVKGMDLLQDISEFRECAKMFLDEYKALFGEGYLPYRYGESGAAGTLQAVLSYAEMDFSEIEYFPIMSHVSNHWWCFPSGNIKKGIILPGERYKKFIHRQYAYVPVYSSGSYIHYAKGYYDDKTFGEMKNKYGKVLTIFMPHSTEGHNTFYQEKEFIDRILLRYKKDFDSIWACLYWTDTFSVVYDYLRSEGIHVVCAGYRGDTTFIQRLKTIIQLSDGIVCGEVGSAFGYAFACNKPVAYFDVDARHTYEVRKGHQWWLTGDDVILKEGYRQLFNEELQITKDQKVFINEVAGCDIIRDKKYFQNVLEISKDIWKMCAYDQSRYPIGVYLAYDFYVKTGDIEKAIILREAVGKNFL